MPEIKEKKPVQFSQSFDSSIVLIKCRRWESNPHERKAHYALNVARLPVPPLRLVRAILPRNEVLSTLYSESVFMFSENVTL